jgi:LysM repeat protein
MYEQSEESRCFYHPGEFMRSSVPAGRAMSQITFTWSCCRAEGEAAAGCVVDAEHVRCEATALALDQFPQDKDATIGLRHRVTAASATEIEKSPPSGRKPSAVPADAAKYTCVVGDSLASVALKHGMRADQVKRWNRLLSSDLFPGKVLYVKEPPPRSAAELRAQALSTIMRQAPGGHCSKEEAAFYLDEVGQGTDVRAALAALKADVDTSNEP